MCDVKPDLTVYLHVPYEVAHARISERHELTVFEKEHEEFTKKLIVGFQDIAGKNKSSISLDGTQNQQELTNQAVAKIVDFIKNSSRVSYS